MLFGSTSTSSSLNVVLGIATEEKSQNFKDCQSSGSSNMERIKIFRNFKLHMPNQNRTNKQLLFLFCGVQVPKEDRNAGENFFQQTKQLLFFKSITEFYRLSISISPQHIFRLLYTAPLLQEPPFPIK